MSLWCWCFYRRFLLLTPDPPSCGAFPGKPRPQIPSGQLGEGGRCYLQLTQDGMVLDAREQDAHSIGPIVEVGDS